MRSLRQLVPFVLLAVLLAACHQKAAKAKPVKLTQQEQHGRQLYGKLCSVCHGANGEGYKADEAPRLAQHAFLGAVDDAYLIDAIANGRPGTTMSAWSTAHRGPLTGTDVDAVVAYIRTWDDKPAEKLDNTPVSGNVRNGQAIFNRECVRCHGAQGVGGPNVHIGSSALLKQAKNGFLRLAIEQGRPGTKMPAFGKKLGHRGVEDVLSLLRIWQARNTERFEPLPHIKRPPPIPLGPVPLNPKGPEPVGFKKYPATTSALVVKKQLDRHARMAILDARAPSDYSYGHIAGAVSVPFYGVDPYVSKLPRNTWLVCYCSCPHAESGELASALEKKGFKKVTVIAEGLGFWKAKGFPTKKGDKP